MSSPATGTHGARAHRDRPWVWWVAAAGMGVALGVLLGLLAPLQPAAHAGGVTHAAPVVIETRPDGARLLRQPDETAHPLTGRFTPADPASIAAVTAAAGPIAGAGAEAPVAVTRSHAPPASLVLCIPFVALLVAIAVMPLVSERLWHAQYPAFALGLGGLVLGYELSAFGAAGAHEVRHALAEYVSFIALVGGLYVVSGGILIDVRQRGRAATNTALLAVGCVLANLVGTTGASVLLIRPFLRMNQGRLRPIHAVFFIFIVSNCAGCLTPIGDPPLYLGYLKGLPFFWTATNLWPMWLLVNGVLLALFFIVDSRIAPAPDEPGMPARKFDPGHRTPLIAGWPAVGFLVLLVACVFIDPWVRKLAPGSAAAEWPIGAVFQIALAATAYLVTRPSIHHANHFTFGPVKEVGFLFVGIFLTMAPALGYLREHAGGIGLESPSQFYFGAGGLSAVLDNAPTYLSFLQVAMGVLHLPLDPSGIERFIDGVFDIVHPATGGVVHLSGGRLLRAISLGAVLFGAMTYIGNGPNFMVKSIVEAARSQGGGLGVRMPSFAGYVLYAALLLLPVLVVNWLVFIR